MHASLQHAYNSKDTLPEWSKGVDSSSTSASCVGSNPTGVISQPCDPDARATMHPQTTGTASHGHIPVHPHPCVQFLIGFLFKYMCSVFKIFFGPHDSDHYIIFDRQGPRPVAQL